MITSTMFATNCSPLRLLHLVSCLWNCSSYNTQYPWNIWLLFTHAYIHTRISMYSRHTLVLFLHWMVIIKTCYSIVEYLCARINIRMTPRISEHVAGVALGLARASTSTLTNTPMNPHPNTLLSGFLVDPASFSCGSNVSQCSMTCSVTLQHSSLISYVLE